MNSLECFDINEKPLLHVKVSDFKNENSVEIDALIDTGFSGWLLLNYEIYTKLNSLEIPITRKYRSILGNIEVFMSKASISINRLNIDAFIESSPYVEMNLLGREILKKLNICFYRMNKICIYSDVV
ncbi:clan AA aspartic protease [Saccharolobus solfataricus]|uniref:Clan AA aspartic protease n=1 Tax=Saccharolobus solfataricus TaxID=2287 RepID=A0A7S9IHB8_SACSO|nr:clan AA aspartic protease [Saccharolobus solfataricus]QPG49171.1 clan AA aspartic protease [Saccharolobus solfataricus]